MTRIRGRKGYEYNADFMTEVFGLYCQGLCATGIAERMQEQWPNVCRQTVSRIINKHGWKKQRAEMIGIKVRGKEEKQSALELLQKTRDRLEKLCAEGSENHQHYAQLLRTLEMQGKIAGWLGGGEEGIVLSTNKEMNAWLDAVEEVMGDGYKREKRAIKRVYEKKLKGEE